MNLLVVGVLIYVVAQLLIGLAVSRGIKNESDYLVAGRRLGYPLAIFSIFATWFGAETCVGAAGAVYTRGLAGGTSDPFGYSICLLFMGVAFATALWRGGYLTLGDLFRTRYGPAFEKTIVVLIVPTSILWASAQIRAFGQVLTATSGWQLPVTILIAAAVVIIYTTSGGLLADATTDVIQGIALIIGLVALLIAVVVALGGPAEAAGRIVAQSAALAPRERGPWLDTAEAWLVPILGSVTAQELASRILAARSARVGRNSTLIASGAYLAVGLVPVALGFLGASLLPGIAEPEQILPQLARVHLHGVLYVLFAGALVSAILSTVDSNLLSAASLVSHNLVVPAMRAPSERAKVRAARIGVVVAGLVSTALAFSAEGVYELVEDASAFGGAGIFVVMAFALKTRFGGTRAAFAALISGAVVQIAGTYFGLVPYPFTSSLAVSTVAYVMGTVPITRP
jgi:solute:Na+ symporter, SSS family